MLVNDVKLNIFFNLVIDHDKQEYVNSTLIFLITDPNGNCFHNRSEVRMQIYYIANLIYIHLCNQMVKCSYKRTRTYIHKYLRIYICTLEI